MNQVINRSFINLIVILLGVLSLSACRGMMGAFSFSPEQAAINAVSGNIDPNAAMVPNSIVVTQSVEARDDYYVVVMTFNQTRANSGDETCLYTYEVQKMGLGWAPKSGGGGCWTPNHLNAQGEQLEDIQIGSSQSSSSAPGDAGFSQTYGLVRNPEIVKAKVTWNDGAVEEVEVTNNTFVSFRFGLFDMSSLEGLNSQGEVIYTHGAPQVAPGKQP